MPFVSHLQLCSRLTLLTNRILDNLPVAMVKLRVESGIQFKTYERGCPVGFKAQVEVSFESMSEASSHVHLFECRRNACVDRTGGCEALSPKLSMSPLEL